MDLSVDVWALCWTWVSFLEHADGGVHHAYRERYYRAITEGGKSGREAGAEVFPVERSNESCCHGSRSISRGCREPRVGNSLRHSNVPPGSKSHGEQVTDGEDRQLRFVWLCDQSNRFTGKLDLDPLSKEERNEP